MKYVSMPYFANHRASQNPDHPASQIATTRSTFPPAFTARFDLKCEGSVTVAAMGDRTTA